MKNKRMLAFAVVCSVGACLAPLTLAISVLASAQPEVRVEFGFSGHYYPGVPTPITILLENQGSPIRGRLLLEQEVKRPWRGVFEESLALPIELPPRAKELLQLYFPIHGHIYPLRIQLWEKEGEKRRLIYQGEIDLRRRYHKERLCLFLSDPGAPLPLRLQVQGGVLPTGERPIWVEPKLLPSKWSGYLGVRRIYLGRLEPSALSKHQWEAISKWVCWGGELVILGGENWYYHQENPFLREFLALLLEAPKVADREGHLIVLGEPRGEVLHRTEEGLPVLITARWGRGRVILSTIDPLSSPLGERFWRELKVSPADRAEGNLTLERPELARELLGRQEVPYPSRLPLVGLYSVFLGGLILLRAFVRRRQLLLVLLWTAGVTLLGSLYLSGSQGTRPLFSIEVGIVHDMGEFTLSSTWWGLFAKKAAALSLPLTDGNGSDSDNDNDNEDYLIQLVPKERGEHLYDLSRFLDRDGRMRLSFRLERWMGRYFYGERFTSDLASLKLDPKEGDGSELVLRAINLGAEPLHDCTLFVGDGSSAQEQGRGRFYPLGDLPPGKAVEAELELSGAKSKRQRGPSWLEGELEKLYRLATAEGWVKEKRPFLLCWAKLKELKLPDEPTGTQALKLVLIEEDRD